MKRMAIAVVIVLLVGLVAFVALKDTNPTEERLRTEYAKLKRVHDWYNSMMPLWDVEKETGRLSADDYTDTLKARLAISVRMGIVRDSIEIINGRDPHAWRKRPE